MANDFEVGVDVRAWARRQGRELRGYACDCGGTLVLSRATLRGVYIRVPGPDAPSGA